MRVIAEITTKWGTRNYVPLRTDHVESYTVDGAMDTDTDSWTVEIGDPENKLIDVLRRDNEVRVDLYGLGGKGPQTLHRGFVDEATLDESGTLTMEGRDISSVATDSQHPPQIWRQIRPESLVKREAQQLKIGDLLRLTPAKGFKTYATDGSESYWQVWYRFYRKRRMWMWATPDGALVASPLDYNQRTSYYFGRPISSKSVDWIPVERASIRANKSQRVGDVFYFGHRGDHGFVSKATDPTTRQWIRKPTIIVTSGDAHNAAEARVEAWEEIFESKVGALEITLTIADPGFVIQQNKMAIINLPKIGLIGEWFVVGVQIVGSVEDGLYQVVRLREKNYAISRRVPSDPNLRGDVGPTTTQGVAGALEGPEPWKAFFVEAAQKYRGPWAFQLFLGVLLSIADKESTFRNVREGGQIIYPGNFDTGANDPIQFQRFAATYANDPKYGRVSRQYGVGPMQLTDRGYKLAADRLEPGGQVENELTGGRWNPRWNINVGAAVLASKLGAGWGITADGHIVKTPVTGLSLDPTEQNIWDGVRAYNGSGDAAVAYMKEVKQLYNDTYKAEVEAAVIQARTDAKQQPLDQTPAGSDAEVRNRVLNSKMITFTRASQRDDIRYGMIHKQVIQFLYFFTNAGFPVTIWALKSDHDKFTSEGKISAHGYGLAVDLGNYNTANSLSDDAMRWIKQYQLQLGFSQLIGPHPSLVVPFGIYDSQTLAEHRSHIHVGWPLALVGK